jgi:hypothetical protein
MHVLTVSRHRLDNISQWTQLRHLSLEPATILNAPLLSSPYPPIFSRLEYFNTLLPCSDNVEVVLSIIHASQKTLKTIYMRYDAFDDGQPTHLRKLNYEFDQLTKFHLAEEDFGYTFDIWKVLAQRSNLLSFITHYAFTHEGEEEMGDSPRPSPLGYLTGVEEIDLEMRSEDDAGLMEELDSLHSTLSKNKFPKLSQITLTQVKTDKTVVERHTFGKLCGKLAVRLVVK